MASNPSQGDGSSSSSESNEAKESRLFKFGDKIQFKKSQNGTFLKGKFVKYTNKRDKAHILADDDNQTMKCILIGDVSPQQSNKKKSPATKKSPAPQQSSKKILRHQESGSHRETELEALKKNSPDVYAAVEAAATYVTGLTWGNIGGLDDLINIFTNLLISPFTRRDRDLYLGQRDETMPALILYGPP